MTQTRSAIDECQLPTGLMLFSDPETWKSSSEYTFEQGDEFVLDNLDIDQNGNINCRGGDSAPDYRESVEEYLTNI